MGAQMVRKTIDMLIDGRVEAVDQDQFISTETVLKSAPKIFKETCEINVNATVDEVYNFVRGLSPYPSARIEVELPAVSEKIALKVYETSKEKCTHSFALGTVQTDGKTFLKVAVSDGFIHLLSLQAPAKKRMSVGDFLRGLR